VGIFVFELLLVLCMMCIVVDRFTPDLHQVYNNLLSLFLYTIKQIYLNHASLYLISSASVYRKNKLTWICWIGQALQINSVLESTVIHILTLSRVIPRNNFSPHLLHRTERLRMKCNPIQRPSICLVFHCFILEFNIETTSDTVCSI